MGSSVHRRCVDVHVAFLAFPFGTHAAPLFSLARSLAAAAPDATFSFFNSARSNASLRRGTASEDAAPNLCFYDVEDGRPEGYDAAAHHPEEEVRLFLAVTPGNFKVAVEAAVAAKDGGGKAISCVVSDAFLWFAGGLAAEMGVPLVALWTGGPSSLLSHLDTDVLRRRFLVDDEVPTSREDELLSFIPPLAGLRLRDLPEGVVLGNLNSAFADMLYRMAGVLPNAAAVVANTFQGLDPALDAAFATRFAVFLSVGPLNLLTPKKPQPDPSSCIPWLDGQAAASVAYISFGTVICPPPPELAELAAGLESSGAAFLWSLKEESKAHLPAGFLQRIEGRGLVVPWTPQERVLNHPAVGAFITHCGWNSVLEGVVGGVPMMCRPFLGDQRINARVVSHVWEVGVTVEGGVLSREGVAGALDLLLRGEGGRRMRTRAAEMKEKALQAVRADGTSAQGFDALLDVITGRN